MFNRKKIVLSILISLPLFAGCADQSYRTVAGNAGSTYNGGNYYAPVTGSTSTSTSSSTTDSTTTTDTTDTTSNSPTTTASFSMQGVNSAQPSWSSQGHLSISTDNLLKITIRAGQAGALTLSNGTQNVFTANYSCVSYLVTVNGRSVRTKPLLANGVASSYCSNGVESQTIDFSDRLTAGGDAPVVTISDPRYDFYCQIWYGCQTYPNMYLSQCSGFSYNYYNTYCPNKAVFKNHTVTGDLDIYTN